MAGLNKIFVNNFLVQNFFDRDNPIYKMCVIERDDNGKRLVEIDNPMFTFHTSKTEFQDEHAKMNPLFIPKEQVEQQNVPYRELFGHMNDHISANDTDKGRVQKYARNFRNCIQRNNQYGLKKMHSHPFFHGTDADIADHYIERWMQENKEDMHGNPTLTKGFFDIESDVIDHMGFPDEEEAPCITNAISYHYKETDTTYGFFLRNAARENPQIAPFEADIDNFIDYMKEEYGINNLEIQFFDTELELILHFFKVVNEVDRPDTLGAWNLSYDFRTLLGRIKKLTAADPALVMCPVEFVEKNLQGCYYYKDQRAKDIDKKGDFAQVNGFTQWIDQMIIYAKIRATMGKKESYALDAVLNDEINARKVSLDNTSIKYMPYKNYRKFAEYSIIDTYRLRQLDDKIQDIDLMYALVTMTSTRMVKALTKTTSLRNLIEKFFNEQGIILSNNPNQNAMIRSKEVQSKFKGAFVADPNLMLPVGVQCDIGQMSKVFNNVFDLDLASLYPHIILATNIDGGTLYFHLVIHKDGITEENDDGEEVMKNFAPEFMESLSSRDLVTIGYKWCDLPNLDEIVNDLEELGII